MMDKLKDLTTFDGAVLIASILLSLAIGFDIWVTFFSVLFVIVCIGLSGWWLVVINHLNTLTTHFEQTRDSLTEEHLEELEAERLAGEDLLVAIDGGITLNERVGLLVVPLLLAFLFVGYDFMLVVGGLLCYGYSYTTSNLIDVAANRLYLIYDQLLILNNTNNNQKGK